MSFDEALAFTLAAEGGLVDDPNDPGGLTRWGISSRAYPALDIAALTKEQAAEIYRTDYWLRCACDALPGPVAIAVFDHAVHSGPAAAVRTLQEAIGIDPDGRVGPLTISAARASCAKRGSRGVAFALVRARALWLCAQPSQQRYIAGFMRRCFDLAEVVLGAS